jgi:predicted DsbA family dithiol-disulfide isomerase
MGIRSVPQFVIQGGATIKGCPSEGELISAIRDAVSVSTNAGCAEGVCSL